jgi:hypothetical protein
MSQISLQYEPIITACARKAETVTPGFAELAKKHILAHLSVVQTCPGEELVDIAIAKGAKPHDARAFGSVFMSLSRRGLIRKAGYCERKKGHSTAGGIVWGMVHV